ncbi:hypothetical protein D3C77_458900 [compost metagenome]
MNPLAGLGYRSVRCSNVLASRQILPAAYSGQALDGFTVTAGVRQGQRRVGWGVRTDAVEHRWNGRPEWRAA